MELRCYGLTSPRHDNKLSVHFTNVEDYRHEWDLDALPWDAVSPVPPGEKHPESLDPRLLQAINERALSPGQQIPPKARAASLAFLYLYMTLTYGGERPSFNFTVRSTLPVGAGLGSSAAFSACVATALLLLHQRIELPPLPPRSRAPSISTPGHIHVSHQGRRAITPAIAEEINQWAFVSEKVLHGNPSGIDNSIVVFGGALAYTKPGFGRKSGMEKIHGFVFSALSDAVEIDCSLCSFKSLKFLLTDSKVGRDTKALVANVAQKKLEVSFISVSKSPVSDDLRRNLILSTACSRQSKVLPTKRGALCMTLSFLAKSS